MNEKIGTLTATGKVVTTLAHRWHDEMKPRKARRWRKRASSASTM